jgi:predicted metal-dependent hydrolase
MTDPSELDASNCHQPLHPKAIEGLKLFNRGRYFEAHEALEAAWREETGPVRNLYRGILQAGVVYLHITRRNYPGAIKVYQRCRKWLAPWPEACRGVSVGQLRRDLETIVAAIQQLGPERIAEFNLSSFKPVHYSLE